MHEYSLSLDIMDLVIEEAKKNNANRINNININVDPLTNANPIQLKFCLELAAKNTIAESSKINISFLDIELICSNNHFKKIPFNIIKETDICSIILRYSNKKCEICNEMMKINNTNHGIYISSIDID